jgi:hypothetical protein
MSTAGLGQALWKSVCLPPRESTEWKCIFDNPSITPDTLRSQ